MIIRAGLLRGVLLSNTYDGQYVARLFSRFAKTIRMRSSKHENLVDNHAPLQGSTPHNSRITESTSFYHKRHISPDARYQWSTSHLLGSNVRTREAHSRCASGHGLSRWYSTTQSTSQRGPSQQRTKKRPYSAEEDSVIRQLRSQRSSWKDIQERLPHRTAYSLRKRWEQHVRPDVDFEGERLIVPYSQTDAKRLVRLRDSGLSWQNIRDQHFPKRTIQGLRHLFDRASRYSYVPGSVPQIPFSAEEREKLVFLKNEQQLSWSEILEQMPKRSFNSLSSAYHRLVPPAHHPERTFWSAAEDDTLRRLKVSSSQ